MLGDRPHAGVLIALAVGDQRAIPSSQWQVFTRTGVNHLMSISGLHITMVGGLVAGSRVSLWRRTRWSLRIPALKAAAAAGLIAAFAYALDRRIRGARTAYGAHARGRRARPAARCRARAVHVLAVALFVVVLFDPWAVTAAGFWLSFGAVAVILYVTTGRIGQTDWLMAWGRVQWAVTVGLVPLLLALFQQVSIASPVANAVAIPVISLVVVPLTLVGCIPPFGFLLSVADFSRRPLHAFLELFELERRSGVGNARATTVVRCARDFRCGVAPSSTRISCALARTRCVRPAVRCAAGTCPGRVTYG